MKNLVLGSSGATGKLVVAQLLKQNIAVIAILRPSSNLPEKFSTQSNLQIIKTEITQLQNNELAGYLHDCDGVISCLGHNLTFKGMFGRPKLLVTDAIEVVYLAIESISTNKKFKLILMNTTGNSIIRTVGLGCYFPYRRCFCHPAFCDNPYLPVNHWAFFQRACNADD